MKVEQMASATITGTPEEISRAISLIRNNPGNRLIEYPKLQMVQVIRKHTGKGLLECRDIAEEILSVITA